MTRAVLLDRDGVINEIVQFPDLGILDSPLNPSQFKLMPKAGEAISGFNSLGLKVIVVSNQPAIAKGKTTIEQFNAIRSKMASELKELNAHIDGEYYCFHHPQATIPEFRKECNCRKPKPGLILEAAKDFGLDLSKTFMIGDSISDVEAGKNAGCRTFLIGTFKCDLCKYMQEREAVPDLIVNDVFQAYEAIKRMC